MTRWKLVILVVATYALALLAVSGVAAYGGGHHGAASSWGPIFPEDTP